MSNRTQMMATCRIRRKTVRIGFERRFYQMSDFKPVVGQNIALHAAPAYIIMASTYLVSTFPAHHTASFSPNFSNRPQWNVHVSSSYNQNCIYGRNTFAFVLMI